MPRYKPKAKGDGARYEQPIYKTVDGQRVETYRVWRGYDHALTLSGKRIKISHQCRKGESRADLDREIKKKIAELPTDQTSYIASLEAEIARLKSQIEGMIAAPDQKTYPTLDEICDAYFNSSAIKRQKVGGGLKKNKGLYRNYIKIPVKVGVESLGSMVARDLKGADLQTLDKRLQETRDGWKYKPSKAGEKLERAVLAPYGPKSFGNLKDFIATVLFWGMQSAQAEWTGLRYNVASEYVPDRSPDERVTPKQRARTPQEVIDILDYCLVHDTSLAAMLALIATGDRVNVARTLEWGKWDAEQGGFIIEGQWQREEGEGGKEFYDTLKNGVNGEKLLIIPPVLLPYVLACKEWSPRWVVPQSRQNTTTHLKETNQRDRWAKVKTALGITEDITPYIFKHSTATAVANTLGLDIASQVLGVGKEVVKKHYAQVGAGVRVGAISAAYANTKSDQTEQED